MPSEAASRLSALPPPPDSLADVRPVQVQPLKIVKSNSISSSIASPAKMPRPLSELGSTERRRNSPSYNQASRKPVGEKKDSSPFDSSPLQQRSPRMFWEGRVSPSRFGSENSPERGTPPPLVSQRQSSIENLKKASRVKNSSMYAKETKNNYDPSSSPVVERPLSNRGWGGSLQGNAFARFDSLRKENNPISASKIPGPSPAASASSSPIKSSLTSSSRYGQAQDPDNAAWSEDEDENMRASTPALPATQRVSPSRLPRKSTSSYDSDDYEDNSFEHGSSAEEDSFDASLEDTDKTPVVLPEDWRHMSPDVARNDLTDDLDDVFDDAHSSAASPSPPAAKNDQRPSSSHSESALSDTEARPLPPIPPFRIHRTDSGGLIAAAERASSLQRSLPSPPRPASVSKDEILRMREANMSLEDRMGLLALQESLADVRKSQQSSQSTTPDAEPKHEKPADADGPVSDAEEQDDLAELADFDVAPSISRESILRNVKSQKYDDMTEVDMIEDESVVSYADRDYANLDPDVAIPSRETSTQFGDDATTAIKQEDESYLDLSAVPSLSFDPNDSRLDDYEPDYERQSSVIHHRTDYDDEDSRLEDDDDDDEESRYSSPMSILEDEQPEGLHNALLNENLPSPALDDVFSTPTQGHETFNFGTTKPMSLPVLNDFLGADDFDFGLKNYITPSPPPSSGTDTAAVVANPVLDPPELLQPSFPAEEEERTAREGSTDSDQTVGHESFGSVIHGSMTEMTPPLEEAPVIPERSATIKTQGKLRARPSGTPADLEAMRAQRRHVSHEVPAIPDKYLTEQDSDTETESLPDEVAEHDQQFEEQPEAPLADCCEERAGESQEANGSFEDETALTMTESQYSVDDEASQSEVPAEKEEKRRESRKMKKLDLELPLGSADDLSLGLDAEFDRVIATQKKGYLMRQNTKVIVASNRNFSDEQPPASARPTSPNAEANPSTAASRGMRSPRKSSTGEKYLTTEPWNGKTRRKSTRRSSGRKSNVGGPSPPLPGHESNLGVVDEYLTTDESGEGAERGRLFVKVVGVKELDLPMPRNDKLYFQLTLDNGLHCVTTANLELGKSAAIGQEFELVVLQDLEFQLTLTTKLPPPPPKQQTAIPVPVSPTKPTKNSRSAFSRLLSSPKKRAERERKEREEAAEAERRRQEELQRKRTSARPTTWDLLREVVDAKSGSFARAYVSLKSHETQCFGRQLTVDVPCFNEWAIEKDADVVSSVRSKRNNGNPGFGGRDGTIRRPPYPVGKLELQLMYIPKPKEAGDEHMPKSMSAAVREMKAAEQVKETSWEGCLSQQGGDCPYWRRRFFRLQGTKLTAYHEHTRQPRATINLSKATKLIDDRSALVADPTSGHPSKGRRKSAFGEEDDGYQFVEEGFRMRFANGETIDFYADSRAQKEDWMTALGSGIGKPSSNSATAKWTDVVLTREKTDAKAAAKAQGSAEDLFKDSERRASKSGGPKLKRALSQKEVHSGDLTPPISPRTGHRERQQVKSMIY